MSPEQLTNGPIDVRTDLFSLGVTLYEFATGVHPFAAESPMALAARILEGKPQPLSTLRPDLPRQLVLVIERCLQKRPQDRFASAAEMIPAIATNDLRPAGQGGVGWWRTHVGATVGLYFVAAVASWLVRQSHHGLSETLFVIVALAAAFGGVLRGHLLFNERVHDRARVLGELARGGPLLTAADVTIGAALFVEGLWLTSPRPITGVLVAALGLWFGVARVWIEPNTTDAAFGADHVASSRSR
jgi:hypothetical protein